MLWYFSRYLYSIQQTLNMILHSANTNSGIHIAQKKSFPLRISLVNVTKSQKTADLVMFIKEILNGKLHFLCSVIYQDKSRYTCSSLFFSIKFLLQVLRHNYEN